MESYLASVIPAKVKNFLWRLFHNSLPTKANLYGRKIVNNNLCPLCQLELETSIHLLWNCRASNDIWAASPIPTHKWQRFFYDINSLWDKVTSCLEITLIEHVAIIFRHIWVRRNVFVF